MTEGHRLRHDIISQIPGIDVFGRGYNEISDKGDGLRDYRFSIVVENVKKSYWFTEKIIDCFMTGTIPIYWGCPEKEHFLNWRGVVPFSTVKDVHDIVKWLTPEFYNSKLPEIEKSFESAKDFILAEDWIYKNIKNINP